MTKSASPETKGRPKRGLGRGLDALFGDDAAVGQSVSETLAAQGPHRTVAVSRLHPGRFQPRRAFDDDAIAELVESIREKGVLQPLLVREHPDRAGDYEIIAGERRWRAAQQAQVHELPVVVSPLSDREALEVALIENLQRQDLSPLEEAGGYRRLMAEFQHTQEGLGRALGKSRSHVANMLRLLNLPEGVRELVSTGQISAGHARALLAADDPEACARIVVEQGLNVRQTEKLVQAGPAAQARRKKPSPPDADTRALEQDLTDRLGLKVTLRNQGSRGALTLHYDSNDQLDDLLRRLS